MRVDNNVGKGKSGMDKVGSVLELQLEKGNQGTKKPLPFKSGYLVTTIQRHHPTVAISTTIQRHHPTVCPQFAALKFLLYKIRLNRPRQ